MQKMRYFYWKIAKIAQRKEPPNPLVSSSSPPDPSSLRRLGVLPPDPCRLPPLPIEKFWLRHCDLPIWTIFHVTCKDVWRKLKYIKQQKFFNIQHLKNKGYMLILLYEEKADNLNGTKLQDGTAQYSFPSFPVDSLTSKWICCLFQTSMS